MIAQMKVSPKNVKPIFYIEKEDFYVPHFCVECGHPMKQIQENSWTCLKCKDGYVLTVEQKPGIGK